MLARLAGSMRIRAGRLFALAYLFCVLVPAFALALGNAAPCLDAEPDSVGVTMADCAHDGQHHHGKTSHGKTSTGGDSSMGPCCAMLCLSAIPADPPVIGKPTQPVSFFVLTGFRPLAGEAPPLHYRPPIA
jgi:hypothetical protein